MGVVGDQRASVLRLHVLGGGSSVVPRLLVDVLGKVQEKNEFSLT